MRSYNYNSVTNDGPKIWKVHIRNGTKANAQYEEQAATVWQGKGSVVCKTPYREVKNSVCRFGFAVGYFLLAVNWAGVVERIKFLTTWSYIL